VAWLEKQERNQEDADLRMLYDKASKMEFPVAVVTPLWVSRSQELGRRALVRPSPPLSFPFLPTLRVRVECFHQEK
jgi:hypothetical protein